MNTSVAVVDNLLREYLVFRGFTNTLKQLDTELKSKKEKPLTFKVDQLTEKLCALISSFDINGLYELWEHLNEVVFIHLSQDQARHADRLENDIYKLYLANCVQQKKPEKMHEFFNLLAPKFHKVEEWTDWFALPYMSNVSQQGQFRRYFHKQWQETFLVCLHNFLSLAFHQMPPPLLLAHPIEQSLLARRPATPTHKSRTQVSEALSRLEAPPSDIVSSIEVMDDFSVIAQDRPMTAKPKSRTTLKSVILKKFTNKS